MIGSSTIAPGSKATIGAHVVSVGEGDIDVDGTSYSIPSDAGSILVNNANSNSAGPVTLLNGDVISAGGKAAMLSGTTISILPSHEGLLVGSKTIPIPSAPSLGHVLTAAGEAFTAVNGQIFVSGSTLSEGTVTTIHGTRVSLGDAGLVVGSNTIPLPTAGPPSAIPAITALGQTFSQVDASHVAFDDITLSIGGAGASISGTEVSFGEAGLVVGSSTLAFPTTVPSLTSLGHTFVPVDGSKVAIAGTTFSIGGNGTTISGSIISVGSSGLVIGTTTIPISVPSAESAMEAMATDGYTFSRLDSSRVVVDGTTLTEGGAAKSLDGTLVSIGASDVVIGSRSIPFIKTVKATVTTTGYGDFIIGGLGGNGPAPTQPPSSSATASEASAAGSRARGELGLTVVAITVWLCTGLLAFWI